MDGMDEIYGKIYDDIYNKVVEVCQDKDNNGFNFDKEKYDRVIHHVIKASYHEDSHSRELLKYASLLYPIYKYYHSLDHASVRNIVPDLEDKMVNHIIMIILNKSSILNDCIRLDNMSPTSLYDKALKMLRWNIPLYTFRTPLIRDKNRMSGICFKHKKITTFMEYLYHEGMFLKDEIKSENPYILHHVKIYHDHIISIILDFGIEETIDLENIKYKNV